VSQHLSLNEAPSSLQGDLTAIYYEVGEKKMYHVAEFIGLLSPRGALELVSIRCWRKGFFAAPVNEHSYRTF